MTHDDVLYAAGLFDGEGTVTLVRANKTKMRSPAVSLSSTTYELVEFMKEHFGGAIIELKKSKSNPHWKQAWHWQLSYDRAIDALRSLSPYLREPEKKRRANLILERYKLVTPRNGRYTEELLEQREIFEKEFFGA